MILLIVAFVVVALVIASAAATATGNAPWSRARLTVEVQALQAQVANLERDLDAAELQARQAYDVGWYAYDDSVARDMRLRRCGTKPTIALQRACFARLF